MIVMGGMTLVERSGLRDEVDPETYRRVYAVLESETFSWVTDAWERSHHWDSLRFEPCPTTIVEAQPQWDVDQLAWIQASCDALASQHLKLFIDGTLACVVTIEVRDRLVKLLER